jgi:hypothetical protein
MIRHCIINTNTNKVINIIDYETQQTGVPLGFETEAPHLSCVANDVAGIDWDYINNEFVDNRPRSTTSLPQE